MNRFSMPGLLMVLCGCVELAGCSQPPDARSTADADAIEMRDRSRPQTEEEIQLLQQIATLSEGASSQLGKVTVSVESSYLAASGATCKQTAIVGSKESDGQRLACHDEQGWFFAPDVQGGMVGAKP
jgi:hypothetical protein